MLIEFRVKNFASFQEEQVLSLVATKEKTFQENNTFSPPAQNPIQLLKGAVIYGANASGKTNLIKAMNSMRWIVLIGLKKSMEQLPITPFLLGEQNDIAEFEISFYAEKKRYRYGFSLSLTQTQIIKEYLFVYETNKQQKWFKREWRGEDYVWEYGPKLLGEKKTWQKVTRKDMLFLTTALQLNNQQFLPIDQWFRNFKITTMMWSDAPEIGASKSETKRKQMIDMLKCADLDIQDFQIKEENFDPQTLPNHLPNFMKEIISKEKSKGKIEILFSHTAQNGKEVLFDIKQESDGTQKFFKLLGPWIDAMETSCVVVIDELSNHLHPYMTKFLVEMFFNPQINTKNAQLIFTTHETSILDQELFRKDQVWFCEKYNKATQLYPLLDFKVNKESNLQDAYLGGRFGALPFFSDITKAFEEEDEKQ